MIRGILLSLAAVSLAACSGANEEVSNAEASETYTLNMDDYNQSFAETIGLRIGQDGYEAEDLMRLYVTEVGVGEGARYDISSDQSGNEKQVYARAYDIADDSVRSQEIVAVITIDGATRTVTDIGMRLQCYRAADPESWTAKPCP